MGILTINQDKLRNLKGSSELSYSTLHPILLELKNFAESSEKKDNRFITNLDIGINELEEYKKMKNKSSSMARHILESVRDAIHEEITYARRNYS